MENITAKKKVEDTSSLIDIILDYLSYWKLFVALITLSLAIGGVIIMTTEREYGVSTSILLKENNGKSGQLGGLEDLGLVSTTNNIDNEILALGSPDLMKQVVQSLEIQTKYYIKNTFRQTEVYTDCPYYVRLEDNASEEFSDRIELSIKGSNKQFVIDGIYLIGSTDKKEFSATLDALPGFVDLPSNLGRLYIAKSDKNKKQVDDNEYNIVIQAKDRVAVEILSQLKITSPTKSSSVLEIKINTNNKQKGEAILRELVKKYNEDNVKENNQTAFNTSLFINERLKDIAIELGGVEKDVENYKQSQGITDLSSETQIYMQQSSSNEQKKLEIETQSKIISLIENFVNKPENKNKPIPNLGIEDMLLTEAIGKYNVQLSDFQRVENSASVENPVHKRLAEELTNTRANILSSISNLRNAININKQNIDRQSNINSSRIHSIPMQERGLLEKMRQQQIKENLYLFLLQKREETNITMASTSDKAKIIVNPRFEGRVAPDVNKIMLGLFIVGFVLSIAIIYIRNLFKVTVTNRQELENLSQVPVIGQIPINEQNETIVVRKDDTSPIVELFRSLRNNIGFVFGNSDKKVILVTSTVSGEGKTFVSINLALSFALNKKKVLLVGLDIRNPQLGKNFNLTRKEGITSYLSGNIQDWHELITPYNENTNLNILQAGIIPPNPNELLMNPILHSLFDEAKKEYDIIIIDTAPVGVISDTFLLSKLSDFTLYVAREQVTHKKSIEFINTQHEQNRLNNIYLVLNGASTKNENYRYGYGHKYGYGEKKKNV